MKIKNIILTLLVIAGFASIFVSCKDDETSQGEIPYLFRPVNFEVKTDKTIATLTWAPVDSAISYTIEISQDSLAFENIIVSDTVTDTKFVVELAGNTRFSARVKANARISEKDSKFNQTITFKTPSENLFLGFSSLMTDQGSASISWLPGANVTKLVFKANGLSDNEVAIDDSEKTNGKKICSSLPNANYTVELYNNQILRGTVNVTIEGDYFLSKGDNLTTILNGITKDSAVVVLKPGIYAIAGTYNVTRNIKIRGLFKDSVQTISPDGAASKYLEINTTNRINYIMFENVDITGYVGGGTSGTKIAYLLNQSNGCNIGLLSFNNCTIRNFGNTPFRLQTTTAKTIDNFVVNNCIINDEGYTSVYAVLNLNAVGTSCYVTNISFTNTTVYNFAGSLILHNSSDSKSVTIENCTFNEISTSGTGTSIRYIVDYNTFNITDGIKIKNCIFGSTPRPYTDGVRSNAATAKTISGSYYTSDYNDNHATTTYSIIGSLIQYSGASTDLFTSPLTGNFKIKDASFAGKNTAGDPRWKP
jgi:hypothetical protein